MLDRMTVFNFQYHQKTGEMYVVFGDSDTPVRCRVFVSRGYAGRERGYNNPAAQAEIGIGPIPRGRWKLGRPADHPRLGRYAIPLTPDLATSTLGRSGFFIHGDSATRPGSASRGCIILPRAARECLHAMSVLWDDVPLEVI